MKTKYYVPVSDHSFVKYWVAENGVDYFCEKNGNFVKKHLYRDYRSWDILIKKNIVREAKIEEIVLL
jgi:hypothetical protein